MVPVFRVPAACRRSPRRRIAFLLERSQSAACRSFLVSYAPLPGEEPKAIAARCRNAYGMHGPSFCRGIHRFPRGFSPDLRLEMFTMMRDMRGTEPHDFRDCHNPHGRHYDLWRARVVRLARAQITRPQAHGGRARITSFTIGDLHRFGSAAPHRRRRQRAG